MYESHVTVDGLTDEEFTSICQGLGVKPVIIEDDTGSADKRQMMTAKFHKTIHLDEARAEMDNISTHFHGHVIRHKLEKIIGKNSNIPEHLYLEFHLKYEVPAHKVVNFVATVLEFGGHTSRNALKQTGMDDLVYHFATARDVDTYHHLQNGLQGYRKINSIMECVILDDNPGLDTNWHGCEACFFKAVPEVLQ